MRATWCLAHTALRATRRIATTQTATLVPSVTRGFHNTPARFAFPSKMMSEEEMEAWAEEEDENPLVLPYEKKGTLAENEDFMEIPAETRKQIAELNEKISEYGKKGAVSIRDRRKLIRNLQPSSGSTYDFFEYVRDNMKDAENPDEWFTQERLKMEAEVKKLEVLVMKKAISNLETEKAKRLGRRTNQIQSN